MEIQGNGEVINVNKKDRQNKITKRKTEKKKVGDINGKKTKKGE